MIIGPLILWNLGHISGKRDTPSSEIRITYPLGMGILGDEVHQTAYPLGITPLILWYSGYPLGNGTWETGHASSGNQTTYFLGNIL